MLLTAQLMSGAYDFEPVCGQEGDILNKLCDYVSNSLNGQRYVTMIKYVEYKTKSKIIHKNIKLISCAVTY